MRKKDKYYFLFRYVVLQWKRTYVLIAEGIIIYDRKRVKQKNWGNRQKIVKIAFPVKIKKYYLECKKVIVYPNGKLECVPVYGHNIKGLISSMRMNRKKKIMSKNWSIYR